MLWYEVQLFYLLAINKILTYLFLQILRYYVILLIIMNFLSRFYSVFKITATFLNTNCLLKNIENRHEIIKGIVTWIRCISCIHERKHK